ncbi:phage tail termination protein [Streptomyces sp. NPDC001880]
MTPTPVLPDAGELVRLALAAAYPDDVTVVSAMPGTWADSLPLLCARVVPGSGAVDIRGLGMVTIAVTAVAADRSAASLLARRAGPALRDACKAQFTAEDGYLSRYVAELVAPFWQRGGDAALNHSGVYRYECTHQVTTRPNPL